MRVFGAQNGSGLERGSPGASLEAQPFPQTPPGLTASGVVGSAGSVGSLTPAQVYLATFLTVPLSSFSFHAMALGASLVLKPVPH